MYTNKAIDKEVAELKAIFKDLGLRLKVLSRDEFEQSDDRFEKRGDIIGQGTAERKGFNLDRDMLENRACIVAAKDLRAQAVKVEANVVVVSSITYSGINSPICQITGQAYAKQ